MSNPRDVLEPARQLSAYYGFDDAIRAIDLVNLGDPPRAVIELQAIRRLMFDRARNAAPPGRVDAERARDVATALDVAATTLGARKPAPTLRPYLGREIRSTRAAAYR